MGTATATAGSGELVAFRRAREEFFVRCGARWPATLADGFDLLEPWVLSAAEVQAIRDAARAVSVIYRRACDLLHRLSDEALLNLAVPAWLIPVIRSRPATMEGTVIGRLDLVRTKSGYKLLEFNADDAGLIVEAFSINDVACSAAGLKSANARCEDQLRTALEKAVQAAGSHAAVVVTAFDHCRRDVATAQYVCSCLPRHAARVVPVQQLAGENMDVLIRIAPMRLLRDLECLVPSHRLTVINSPSSVLLSNKALQAIIWRLSRSGRFFSVDERRLIETTLLPTYLERPVKGGPYVQKPFYGAEGDSVSVVDCGGRVLHRSLDSTHVGGPMIYQEYVPLPAPELMTEFGLRRLHLAISCFLLAGEPSAICIRAGEPITDETAWVMPVAVAS